MPTIWRLLGTLLAITLYGWFTFAVNLAATPQLAAAAGRQFEDNNAAWVASQVTMRLWTLPGLFATITLILILISIWWKPVRQLITNLGATAALVLLLTPQPAAAFWASIDATEAYTILPNESAFWIPDVGPRNDQVQLESVAFLAERKLSVRRFVIPHAKLSGSGGTAWLSGWDYYVPTGRLIIVDRAPYTREWVRANTRGSSAKDESFPCQSREGLNITVGVSIGTSVTEENVARFLYTFGVQRPLDARGQPADRTKPEVIFTSVYYGNSLTKVMDEVVRPRVQALVCDQMTGRTLDKANQEAVAILAAVRTAVTTYLASVGITLDFMGWADTFHFDEAVQGAINRAYVASQDVVIAAALREHAQTLQVLAAAHALRNFGDRSNGQLPHTVVGLPSNVLEMLGALLGQPGALRQSR